LVSTPPPPQKKDFEVILIVLFYGTINQIYDDFISVYHLILYLNMVASGYPSWKISPENIPPQKTPPTENIPPLQLVGLQALLTCKKGT